MLKRPISDCRVIFYIVLILFAMLISSCARQTPGAQRALRMQSIQPAEKAAQAYARGNYREAQRFWNQAITALQPGIQDYYDGWLFQDRYRYLSGIAWVSLLQGKVDQAQRQYAEVLSGLREAEHKYRALMKEFDKEEQTWALVYNALTLAEASYYATHGKPQVLQMAPDLFVSATDTTGLAPTVVGDAAKGDGVRIVVMPSVGPLMKIGRLIGRTSSCTASLVGERLALTNAHCVVNENNQVVLPSERQILFTGLADLDKVNVVEIHTQKSGVWDGKFENDWAVLILDRHPVGRGYFGWLADAPSVASGSENLFLAGHSADINDGRFISLAWKCSVVGTGTAVFQHNCRMWKGASGSPVLVTEGQYALNYIYALNSFGIGDSNRAFDAGGGPLASQFGPTIERLKKRLSEL